MRMISLSLSTVGLLGTESDTDIQHSLTLYINSTKCLKVQSTLRNEVQRGYMNQHSSTLFNLVRMFTHHDRF